MPTLKRTSDAASLDSPNPKRTRLSTTELQLLEKETLIKHVLALQKELGTVESRPAASDAAPALSDEKIEEKAEQARKLMVRGFKSQMKVSSCGDSMPYRTHIIRVSFLYHACVFSISYARILYACHTYLTRILHAYRAHIIRAYDLHDRYNHFEPIDLYEYKACTNPTQWKPTCKNGTAKFSYSGVITSAAVFKRLFNLPADHKKKLFQMDHGAFAEVAGDRIRTSVRYDYLELTGNGVSVRWKEDEGTFSVGGTYGK